MREFKNFLKETNGYRLLKFWLDCEFYRDSMQEYDQIVNISIRNRLFRDINEKYVFSFAKRMHAKISESYMANESLTHNLFDHIQYDVLRRLRVYWVPRFILYKLRAKGKDYGAFPLPLLTPEYSRNSTYITRTSAIGGNDAANVSSDKALKTMLGQRSSSYVLSPSPDPYEENRQKL